MKTTLNGLPRLTVIERYMHGDNEIKRLFNIEGFIYVDSHHVDFMQFAFSSTKIIKPDSISFDFGNKWNFDRLLFDKISDENWQNDIVEYGSTVYIAPRYTDSFCENIKFRYNNGRKETICDALFNNAVNLRNVKKSDCTDELVVIKEITTNIGYELYNVMIIDKSYEVEKETDSIICDYFKIAL